MMKLGVQTHLGQGWSQNLLAVADGLEADWLRDGVSWSKIEKARGVYDFSHPHVAWIDAALARGETVSLTFQSTNALYDKGFTPHSAAGRKAYAEFIAAVLDRFPGVARIEIGNEFNGAGYVSGPVRDAGLQQRDDYYAAIVKAVTDRLGDDYPGVTVLGGAAHSIPVTYLSQVFAHGVLDQVDGIAIHPYTTPPEQFAEQLDLLRAAMGDNPLPIHVTEFGQDFGSLEEAPSYLVKMVAVMAAAGVESASWYALARQAAFANMELHDQRTGEETPGGEAFRFLQQDVLAAGEAERLETDDFTHAYRFGDRVLVLWGEGQRVALPAHATVHDATGRELPEWDGVLTGDAPVIVVARAPLVPGGNLVIAPSELVADTFLQFDHANVAGSTEGFEGPWSWFAENSAGRLTALGTLGGGRANESWTPYLGLESLKPLSVSASNVNPVDFSGGKVAKAAYAVVERYTADEAGAVTIKGHWDVNDGSKDGVALSVRHNGAEIFARTIFDKAGGHEFDLVLEHIRLAAGDTLDFVIGVNGSAAGGDNTQRRIQIFREQGAPADDDQPAGPPPAIEPAEPAGRRQMNGSMGDDVLASQGSADAHIRGLGGNDRLAGGDGDDRLGGFAGADWLWGGAGADVLIGGAGDDVLVGGSGDDRLNGGAGADRLVFEQGWGRDIVNGFGAGDVLDLRGIAGIDSLADLEIRSVGRSTVIAFGADQVTLAGVAAATITADDFLF